MRLLSFPSITVLGLILGLVRSLPMPDFASMANSPAFNTIFHAGLGQTAFMIAASMAGNDVNKQAAALSMTPGGQALQEAINKDPYLLDRAPTQTDLLFTKKAEEYATRMTDPAILTLPGVDKVPDIFASTDQTQ